MADHRVYPVGDGFDLGTLGEDLDRWFRARDLETQRFGDAARSVTVQARTQQDWWRFVGASTALSVTATRQGDNLLVQIGAAKWADKVGVGVAALIVFWPLAALPAYGAYKQKQLIDEAFEYIGQITAPQYVAGQSTASQYSAPPMPFEVEAAVPPSAPEEPVAPEGALAPTETCPSCGETVAGGARFCSHCGAKVRAVCAQCGAELSPGARFCSECGAMATRVE